MGKKETTNRVVITKQGVAGPQGPIGATGPKGDSGDSKKSLNWEASRNTSASSNAYLSRSDGATTFTAPFIVPFDATITNITASTATDETWVAEVRVDSGGGFAVAGSLSVTAADSATGTLSVSVSAGNKVALYNNGTDIDTPSIEVVIVED